MCSLCKMGSRVKQVVVCVCAVKWVVVCDVNQ